MATRKQKNDNAQVEQYDTSMVDEVDHADDLSNGGLGEIPSFDAPNGWSVADTEVEASDAQAKAEGVAEAASAANDVDQDRERMKEKYLSMGAGAEGDLSAAAATEEQDQGASLEAKGDVPDPVEVRESRAEGPAIVEDNPSRASADSGVAAPSGKEGGVEEEAEKVEPTQEEHELETEVAADAQDEATANASAAESSEADHLTSEREEEKNDLLGRPLDGDMSDPEGFPEELAQEERPEHEAPEMDVEAGPTQQPRRMRRFARESDADSRSAPEAEQKGNLSLEQLIALVQAFQSRQSGQAAAAGGNGVAADAGNAGQHLANGGASLVSGAAALVGGTAALVGAVGKGIGAPIVKLGEKITGVHDPQRKSSSLGIGGAVLKEGAQSLAGGAAVLAGGAMAVMGTTASWSKAALQAVGQRMVAARSAKAANAAQAAPGGAQPAAQPSGGGGAQQAAPANGNQAQQGVRPMFAGQQQSPWINKGPAAPSSPMFTDPAWARAAAPQRQAATNSVGGGANPASGANTMAASAGVAAAAGLAAAGAMGDGPSSDLPATARLANAAAHRMHYESLQAENQAATSDLQQKIEQRAQDLGLTAEEVVGEMRRDMKAEDLMGEFSERVNADAGLKLRRQMMNDAMAGAVREFSGVKEAASAQNDQEAFTALKDEWLNWKNAASKVMPTRDDAMTDAARVEGTMESAPGGYEGPNAKAYEAVRDARFAEIDYENSLKKVIEASDESSLENARKDADAALDGWMSNHEKALKALEEGVRNNGEDEELSALEAMNEQSSKRMEDLVQKMPAGENEVSHAERLRQLLEKLKEIVKAIKRLFGREGVSQEADAGAEMSR